MLPITRLHPAKLIAAAVVHGETVYISGQIADDTTQGVKGQTAQILAKIERLLHDAGSDKTRLLAVNIWMDEGSSLYTTGQGFFSAFQNAAANEKQALPEAIRRGIIGTAG